MPKRMAIGYLCPYCGSDRAEVLWLKPPCLLLRCLHCEECWEEGEET